MWLIRLRYYFVLICKMNSFAWWSSTWSANVVSTNTFGGCAWVSSNRFLFFYSCGFSWRSRFWCRYGFLFSSCCFCLFSRFWNSLWSGGCCLFLCCRFTLSRFSWFIFSFLIILFSCSSLSIIFGLSSEFNTSTRTYKSIQLNKIN